MDGQSNDCTNARLSMGMGQHHPLRQAEHLAALQRADFEARQRQMKEQAQQELELATSRQRLEQESLAGLKESCARTLPRSPSPPAPGTGVPWI